MGQPTTWGCNRWAAVWLSGIIPEWGPDSPGASDWKKMKISGTENLFFICYHSLTHLRGCHGAVGSPLLGPQHILLGHLHFLQCRSGSIGSRDPAPLYLQHSALMQRTRHTAAIISPSCESFWLAPAANSSGPSFKHLKAEIICAFSLLNRCSCKSGTYQ